MALKVTRIGSACILGVLSAFTTIPTMAEDHLRIGKSFPGIFEFAPFDVGVAEGIFKRQNLDLEFVDFGGDAKMHQAMTAGSIDVGIGGGQGLAFIAKGAPEIAIAAVENTLADLPIMVPFDSPIKTLDDMKGRTVGISTTGSLTDWAARELSRNKGWGPDGVREISIGDFGGRIAAMKTGQIDSMFGALGLAYQMEERKQARLIGLVSEYVPSFISIMLFASDRTVNENPDALRRLVAGWFQSVAYMRQNKADTVKIGRTVTGLDEYAEEREYDTVLRDFSDDGRFRVDALAAVERSLIETKILETPPEMSKLYTERLLRLP